MNKPRTEMVCRICGGFSSAQTCWTCTQSPVYLSYCVQEAEIQRLKEIEHLAWHLLDDSEVRDYECIVSRRDFDALSELLPEEHP
jgi:hypothetical protein